MNEGIYTGVVVQHSIGVSNGEKQTPFVLIKFNLKGTEEHINAWIYIVAGNEKNLRIARKSLKAIGFDPDTQDIGELQTNPTLLAGKECELELAAEEYNGNTTIKVKWINPFRKPVEKQQLAALTKGLRSVKSKDAEDDDIPF
jgi:hypothetical protein